ncbi:hypothetical protein NDI43_00580 [Microcoleus vaginatus GB2-A3]|uniref:hypothetical protein n=1 Tax=Microcoleus vaginatus TaxID=119532 RepID=UPI0032AC515A
MDIPLFKPEFAFGCGYVQEYERIIGGEGSSATDYVTDVTDVRKKEEGSSATDYVTDVTDVRKKEARSRKKKKRCNNNNCFRP